MTYFDKKRLVLFCIFLSSLVLSACNDPKNEVDQWIDEQDRAIIAAKFPKIEIGKMPVQIFYPVSIDPFQSIRVGVSSFQVEDTSKEKSIDYTKNLHAPPLSDISLQDIKLSGLILGAERVALVRYGQNVFRIVVGTAVGNGQGVVSRIDGRGMDVTQMVDDGTGKISKKVTRIGF